MSGGGDSFFLVVRSWYAYLVKAMPVIKDSNIIPIDVSISLPLKENSVTQNPASRKYPIPVSIKIEPKNFDIYIL